ncbi:MAG TPA: ABC transporter permease [Mobilitalea sp.]|nr:ABC transporter permease [Mobilitalea sp.]
MKTKEKKYNFNFISGCVITGIVILFVLVGIFFTPYDPNQMNATLKNAEPSLLHPFGNDNFGRDIFSRVMEGAGTTFLIAIVTVAIGAVFGTILGAVTGYFGGWVDEVLMRINDGITSFPSILLALILISIFGTGTVNIVLALGIIFIPSFARVIRSEFIVLKEMDFVKNAKLMGAGEFRIMFIHILPNTKTILISSIMIAFNNAVLAEASMSYLGLGVKPPDASLGRMLSEAQAYFLNAPWYAVAPGLMIILTILGVSLMSGGMVNE